MGPEFRNQAMVAGDFIRNLKNMTVLHWELINLSVRVMSLMIWLLYCFVISLI